MIHFAQPLLLLLLPITLFPLLPGKSGTVSFPWMAWLPQDRTGHLVQLARKVLAVATLACLIVALAQPGQSETQIEHIGRGAEISILLDRSSSMDSYVKRIVANPGQQQAQASQSKNDVVRNALAELLELRPNNRYALTMFNVAPLKVSTFTDDVPLILAGLEASDIGRGPNKTHIGLAMLAAIEEFEGRSYTGSRAILLVSDGGAKLDIEIKKKIQRGLKKHRISLYFIYIKSGINTPDLETVGNDVESTLEEVALHVFFRNMATNYKVYQADDPDSMAAAINEMDELQNSPLTYYERVPRVDYAKYWYLAAFGCCLLLTVLTSARLEKLG